MIPIQELMIGNQVVYKGEKRIVNLLSNLDCLKVDDQIVHYEDIYPIPLTIEILRSYGFFETEKDSEIWAYPRNLINSFQDCPMGFGEEFPFQVSEDNFEGIWSVWGTEIIEIVDGMYYNCDALVHIKYLHELQNLFFKWYQQELTLILIDEVDTLSDVR